MGSLYTVAHSSFPPAFPPEHYSGRRETNQGSRAERNYLFSYEDQAFQHDES
jgi:hypothetical protein